MKKIKGQMLFKDRLEAEELYVNGWPKIWTHKELAYKYSVSPALIDQIAAERNWDEKRRRRNQEIRDQYENDMKHGRNLPTKDQEELLLIRRENSKEAVKTAYILRRHINRWLLEHDEWERDINGKIVTDEHDKPIRNTGKRPGLKEMEMVSKINKDIFEIIHFILGPPVTEEDPEHKIVWALDLDSAVQDMSYDELISHKGLIENIIKEYEK